jgi:hypothetical protein
MAKKIVERKIGETFKFEGAKYQIVIAPNGIVCADCAGGQNSRDLDLCQKGVGSCSAGTRSDGKNIKAVKV